jgi:CheY-like chemotaxis protein
MQGLDFVGRLASDPRRAEMVVIALTAEADPSDIERAKAAGCDDVLAKPFDLDRLIETVRRALTG